MKALVVSVALTLSLSAHATSLQSQPEQNTLTLPDNEQPMAPQPGQARPGVAPESGQAHEALAKGHWLEAYKLAVQVIAQRTPDVDALGTLAVSAAMLGDRNTRDAALSKLNEVEPEPRLYAALAQGIADLAAKKTQAAEQQFNRILARMPSDHLALYFRGQAKEQSAKPAEALRDYQAALKSRPDFSPALAAGAQILSSGGAHKEAVMLMERAVEVEPSNQAYRYVLAQIYERAGLKDKARQASAEVLKNMPGAREAQLYNAWNLLHAGRASDVQKAVAELTRIYGAQPVDHLLLAMAAADLRQYADIPRHVTEYLKAGGKEVSAVAGASLVYISLGDGKGALQLYESSGAARTLNPQASINLAVARQLAGQPDEARKLLKQLPNDGGSTSLPAFLLANLALAGGDLAAYRASLAQADDFLPGVAAIPVQTEERLGVRQRADLANWHNAAALMLVNSWSTPLERMADRALAISHADALALYFKGIALKNSGHGEQAIDVLGRAARQAPGFLSVHLALADTLLMANKITEARTILARAEPLARDGHAYYLLGKLQKRAGNAAQARSLLTKALNASATGAWRQDAQRLLNQKN
ncbi:MAG: tetratricopeptide repeat protein [Thiobacillaceae bacterium]